MSHQQLGTMEEEQDITTPTDSHQFHSNQSEKQMETNHSQKSDSNQNNNNNNSSNNAMMSNNSNYNNASAVNNSSINGGKIGADQASGSANKAPKKEELKLKKKKSSQARKQVQSRQTVQANQERQLMNDLKQKTLNRDEKKLEQIQRLFAQQEETEQTGSPSESQQCINEPEKFGNQPSIQQNLHKIDEEVPPEQPIQKPQQQFSNNQQEQEQKQQNPIQNGQPIQRQLSQQTTEFPSIQNQSKENGSFNNIGNSQNNGGNNNADKENQNQQQQKEKQQQQQIEQEQIEEEQKQQNSLSPQINNNNNSNEDSKEEAINRSQQPQQDRIHDPVNKKFDLEGKYSIFFYLFDYQEEEKVKIEELESYAQNQSTGTEGKQASMFIPSKNCGKMLKTLKGINESHNKMHKVHREVSVSLKQVVEDVGQQFQNNKSKFETPFSESQKLFTTEYLNPDYLKKVLSKPRHSSKNHSSSSYAHNHYIHSHRGNSAHGISHEKDHGNKDGGQVSSSKHNLEEKEKTSIPIVNNSNINSTNNYGGTISSHNNNKWGDKDRNSSREKKEREKEGNSNKDRDRDYKEYNNNKDKDHHSHRDRDRSRDNGKDYRDFRDQRDGYRDKYSSSYSNSYNNNSNNNYHNYSNSNYRNGSRGNYDY